MQLLREKGLEDVLVVMGGIIPDSDVPNLKSLGIKGVFQPGTSMQEIVDFIRLHARPQAPEQASPNP
jgi:methylmalonyl-CoA mutase C-terminal domain/subunit